MSLIHKLWPQKHFLLVLLVITIAAFFLRTWKLSAYPTGMHSDEAWLTYNAWTLLHDGTNIYGEKWPITVDMFGDFVSALPSYFTIPAVALFGLDVVALRVTTGIFAVLTLLVSSALVYVLTKKASITLGFAILFAFSPWNILYARASSGVVIDAFWLLSFCLALFVFSRWVFSFKKLRDVRVTQLALATAGVYALSIIAYFTYFTSRLLIPPLGLGILVLAYFLHKPSKQQAIVGALPLLLYCIFPFVIMMSSPLALGRFEQTTLLESQLVDGKIFNDIARSGQAGLPVWTTRVLYNRITENVQVAFEHYVTLFSPEVLLFSTAPPERYHVPNVGVVTPIEYLGLIIAVGYVFIGDKNNDVRLRKVTIWVLWALLFAAVPSGITIDDFPNLQRAVIMTPFLQMAAAIGWWIVFSQLFTLPASKKIIRKVSETFFFSVVLGVLSLPWVFSLGIGLVVHAPYQTPFFRNVAAEDMSHWINREAKDATLLIENRETIFLYPYFFSGEKLTQQSVFKSGKYYVDDFRINNRFFYDSLCGTELLFTEEYEYAIVYTTFTDCKKPWWMTEVYVSHYTDGTPGFEVWKPQLDVQNEYKQFWAEAEDVPDQKRILKEALAAEKVVVP